MIQLIGAQRYAAEKLTESYKVLHAGKGLEAKPLFEGDDEPKAKDLESESESDSDSEEAREVDSESSKKAKRIPHSSSSKAKNR